MENDRMIYVPKEEKIILFDPDRLHHSADDFATKYGIRILGTAEQGDLTDEMNRVGAHAVATRSNTSFMAPDKSRKPKVIDPARANIGIAIRAGEGMNTYDGDDAAEAGIMISNTPGLNGIAVVQYATTAASALLRGLPKAVSDMKEGAWAKDYLEEEPRTMDGLNVVVIGGGKIGSKVAATSRLQGANVTIMDEWGATQGTSFRITNPYAIAKPGVSVGEYTDLTGHADDIMTVIPPEKLNKALEDADVVFVHTPQLDEPVLGEEQIRILANNKRKPVIVDPSRDGNIRTDLVLKELKKGTLGGAAIDVWEHEEGAFKGSATQEMIADLRDNHRLICTSHIGASTYQAQAAVAERVMVVTGELFREGKLSIPGGPTIQGDIPKGRTRAIIFHENRDGIDAAFADAIRDAGFGQVRADKATKGGKYGDGERYDMQAFDVSATPEQVMTALRSTPLIRAIIVQSPK